MSSGSKRDFYSSYLQNPGKYFYPPQRDPKRDLNNLESAARIGMERVATINHNSYCRYSRSHGRVDGGWR